MTFRDNFIVGLPRCNEPWELLAATLFAIRTSTVTPKQVFLVDNGDAAISELGLARDAEDHAGDNVRIHVVRPYRNLGCAGAWNLIHRLAAGATTVILNADCAVAPNTFERILAVPAPAVVLAYGFGCFRIDDEIWGRIGDFDETFYPVYGEDHDYRRRLQLAGVTAEEWPTKAIGIVYPGRERAVTGITHGKHDPDGYQGWRGDRLAWFHTRVAANCEHYRKKWGGGPDEETYMTPFGR